MLAIRVRDQESPRIVYEEMPEPTPGIGDVLVRVEASSFTPTELSWPSTWVDRSGRDRSPAVPGHELSGTVVALGYGTTGLEVGDEVYGLSDWYRDGSLAPLVAVEARNLAPKPASVSHVDAAALPMACLTGWQALFIHGSLEVDETVAINGAAGGVGTLAIQLAREGGARVIAIARGWARDLVSELGADQFVDVDHPETDPRAEADLLFDLVGGKAAAADSALVRGGGGVVSVVGTDLGVRHDDIDMRFFVVVPERSQLEQMAQMVDAGRLRPVIGNVIDLEEVEEAFVAKHTGGVPGKVVVRVPSS